VCFMVSAVNVHLTFLYRYFVGLLIVFSDRYQDDGHLGSLRSPLRTDIDVMGRSRGLRSRDQMRMHSYQHQRRCSRQADEVAEETSLKWQLDR